jgi:excisionase family DNA binding protein
MAEQNRSIRTREWLTMTEASELTKRHERSLRYYIADGRLPAYKLGREFRFRVEDVEALFRPVPTVGNVDDVDDAV